jgi:dTDP-4-dehydrorhamnose 3,5-epimerase-like enzyme
MEKPQGCQWDFDRPADWHLKMSRQFNRGLAWNDPDLAVEWPITEDEAIVLERDLDRPRFSELT